jgi:hypothetical protein
MKKTMLLVGLLTAGLMMAALAVTLVGGGVVSPPEAVAQNGVPDYVGSEKCGECHTEVYSTFVRSGHPWKLNPVVDGQPPDYPFTEIPNPPEGYTWDDISYIIGGYNWKARFIDQEGYIITDKPGATVSDTNYLNQYNFAHPAIDQEAGWVKYKSGTTQLKYDCGTCHTTGYRPEGNQDNRPGIVGTWAAPGIQCEACHGPGSLHTENPYNVGVKVNRDAEECGKCHRRNVVEAVDAKDGFIEHHEQYEELFQGKHAVLDCVQCHNPHSGVVQLRQADLQTTRTQCENCHFQQAKNQGVESHVELEVACADCHMPRIIKSAWGNADMHTGDIRTHLMAIDPDQIGQFSEDGKTALSQIGLDFACRSCHVEGGIAPDMNDNMLQAAAENYHAEEE